MLVSGGVSKITSPPFNPIARNDHRLDAIERETRADTFQIHDAYYDHQDAEKDINMIFPLERLKETEARGEIGRLADHIWSGFMGRIYNHSKVMAESGPNFVNGLKTDGVDVLLAVPTCRVRNTIQRLKASQNRNSHPTGGSHARKVE